MTTTMPANTIDVRTIAPRDRHTQIFARFDALQLGDAMVLVNDHDPRPLFYQFGERRGGQFDWTYLQSGPELWQVQIGRTNAAPVEDDGGCCSGGACGG